MYTFAEKVARARKNRGLTQEGLAELCGVTKRTVASYETDGRLPHYGTLKRLADSLGVTVSYLQDENAADVILGPEEIYIDRLRSLYGVEMASEVQDLLTKSASLFAGGKLDQEAKDQYFLALTNAYIACKAGKETK